MRGIVCRGLRLKFVAGLGIAMAAATLPVCAATAHGIATETSLAVETHDLSSGTQATFSITVLGEDGLPAKGAVSINDHGAPIAGIALNSEGQATSVLNLIAGSHTITAAYMGDSTHKASSSVSSDVQALTGGTPNFAVSVNPAAVSLTAGQSGTVITSVTPVNSGGLSSPMFITLSCSGLPDQSSCTFTPETVEILPGATAPITSSMVLETQAGSTASAAPVARPASNSVAWALLLPGALGLGGLAWGGRRNPFLSRLTLLALLALVTMLGATACNPRYYYYNHGPPPTLPTPSGIYTLIVTAQSSNGVTAITNYTNMVMTVK